MRPLAVFTMLNKALNYTKKHQLDRSKLCLEMQQSSEILKQELR